LDLEAPRVVGIELNLSKANTPKAAHHNCVAPRDCGRRHTSIVGGSDQSLHVIGSALQRNAA
jgi:hypothetical protein